MTDSINKLRESLLQAREHCAAAERAHEVDGVTPVALGRAQGLAICAGVAINSALRWLARVEEDARR